MSLSNDGDDNQTIAKERGNDHGGENERDGDFERQRGLMFER